MKQIIPAIVATVISSVAFVNADAQKLNADMKFVDFKNSTAYISAPDVAAIERKDDPSYLYKINFKAVRDFKNTYADISDETWEESKSGYVARFVLNSVHNMNYYDKKGNWLYSIQRYDETKLPKDVRATVKSNYYDYSITSVQEINMKRNNVEPIYIVHIKDDNKFKTIRFCNDEMEEIPL